MPTDDLVRLSEQGIPAESGPARPLALARAAQELFDNGITFGNPETTPGSRSTAAVLAGMGPPDGIPPRGSGQLTSPENASRILIASPNAVATCGATDDMQQQQQQTPLPPRHHFATGHDANPDHQPAANPARHVSDNHGAWNHNQSATGHITTWHSSLEQTPPPLDHALANQEKQQEDHGEARPGAKRVRIAHYPTQQAMKRRTNFDYKDMIDYPTRDGTPESPVGSRELPLPRIRPGLSSSPTVSPNIDTRWSSPGLTTPPHTTGEIAPAFSRREQRIRMSQMTRAVSVPVDVAPCHGHALSPTDQTLPEPAGMSGGAPAGPAGPVGRDLSKLMYNLGSQSPEGHAHSSSPAPAASYSPPRWAALGREEMAPVPGPIPISSPIPNSTPTPIPAQLLPPTRPTDQQAADTPPLRVLGQDTVSSYTAAASRGQVSVGEVTGMLLRQVMVVAKLALLLLICLVRRYWELIYAVLNPGSDLWKRYWTKELTVGDVFSLALALVSVVVAVVVSILDGTGFLVLFVSISGALRVLGLSMDYAE